VSLNMSVASIMLVNVLCVMVVIQVLGDVAESEDMAMDYLG